MSNLHGTDRKLDYIKIEKNLTTQLKNYVTNANLKTCIVGVSGGIDSAVVSTLAAKTGLSVILLTMPIHQNKDEINRADEHITQLQRKYINVIHQAIDLTQSYENIKQTFISNLKQSEQELYMALVNTRSRLRMTTLYAVAQTNEWLVIGTGNKVEDFGIGFFTKYGDGWVDYSPIGNLRKSEVRKLAQHMGISDKIIQAAPTDGLHPTGATDEDQIGATYDELERAMEKFEEHLDICSSNYSSWYDNIINFQNRFVDRELEVINIFLKRHLANRHKMKMPPIANI